MKQKKISPSSKKPTLFIPGIGTIEVGPGTTPVKPGTIKTAKDLKRVLKKLGELDISFPNIEHDPYNP